MDVLGGSAIMRGEKNLLAHAYFALPISITVEGANILTRNLMQFGQGLIKCHPYLYNQVNALNTNNTKEFDKLFFAHIGLVNGALFKSITFYFTRANFTSAPSTFKRYRQKLLWVSAEFTLLCNTSLLFFGASLKKRENIGARFGDILSWCYLITATLREFDKSPNDEHKNLVHWICNYGFNQIQIAREEIIYNMPFLKVILPLIKLNPIGIKTKDTLNRKIVDALNKEEVLNGLCEGVFISKDSSDALNQMHHTVKLIHETAPLVLKIKEALAQKKLAKSTLDNMMSEALDKNIISQDEFEVLIKTQKAKSDVINVDSFPSEVYKHQK